MTRQTIYRRLRKHSQKRKWGLNSAGAIRTYDGGRLTCPLVASLDKEGKDPWLYGYELGISYEDIVEIVCAADNAESHDPQTRRALLRAVGLPEDL